VGVGVGVRALLRGWGVRGEGVDLSGVGVWSLEFGV